MTYATARRLAYLAAVLAGLAVSAACVYAAELKQEVPATRQLGKRLVILLDVSGSMRGTKAGKAVAAVREIAGAPTDELQVAVIAWADSTRRYPAEGWISLPDAVELQALEAWLQSLPIAGDTLAAPALRRASAEPADVVLVTDGVFQAETPDAVVAAWTSKRVLACYGIGGRREVLAQLGRKGGGGYWRAALPPVTFWPH